MKPLKTEVAFATPWFQVLAKTMREGEEPYYSLKLPDYAAVVAVTEDQQVLIVRQYRPAVEHDTLELPSGIVDPGETPGEIRRLRESLARAEATIQSLQERCEDLEEDKAQLGLLCVASAQRTVGRDGLRGR